MGYSVSLLRILVLLFLTGVVCPDNFTSHQPFFVPKEGGAPTSWTDFLSYSAGFFIVPVVACIAFTIIVSLVGCLNCFCPKCICSGPCCFNNRIVLIAFWTGWMLLILGASIIGYKTAPLVTRGIDVLVGDGNGAISDLTAFLAEVKDKLATLENEIKDSLYPVLNANNTLNDTNYETLSDTEKAIFLLEDIDVEYDKIKADYVVVKAGLAQLKTGEGTYYPVGTIPTLSNLTDPEILESDLTLVNNSLYSIANEANAFYKSMNSLIPANSVSAISNFSNNPSFSNFKPSNYFAFPSNFSLPFDFSNLFNFSIPSVDGLFNSVGIANPFSSLNTTTWGSIPFDVPSIKDLLSEVDQQGGAYTVAVVVLCSAVIIAFSIWYIGIFTTCSPCLRVPLCCMSCAFIPLGVLIGIHLTFGAVTDTFCVYHIQFLEEGSLWVEQATKAKNMSEPQRSLITKVLSDPTKLLSCSGNDTIFTLYNISIFNDLGFGDQLYNLSGLSGLNYSLPNVNDDTSIQALYSAIYSLKNNSKTMRNYVIYEIEAVQNFTNKINSSAPGASYYNNTAQNVTIALKDMNQSLYIIQNDLTELLALADEIASSRLSLISDFFSNIDFPFFKKGYFSDLLHNVENALTECSWIHDMYQRVIVVAICTDISPGLLYVGYSVAGVVLLMFFSFPIVIFSLNLE